nr:CDP-glycerol glycerophosphotransferase family protein [Erysipelotrichaceae bacterium]
KSSLRFVKAAFQSARMTDCCITNSEFENEVMRSTYWPDTKLLEYGHARNDIFFDGYAEKRRQIRKDFLQQHNLPEDCKLLLYAPTFRDDDGFDAYGIDVEAVMDALRQRFGGQWYLMLRYHPVYRKIYARNNIINGSNVIDVTLYPDMQEILTLADAGITDYSSWILDYVLQRKPGFLYASDIARYNKERGFYYPLTESPFPLAENNEQLIRNILEFNEEEYKEKVEQFLIGKGCVENGTASKKTVDYMLSLMNISEMKQADK